VGKRKDLIMAERRKFSATFKRQVVEELLSQSSIDPGPTEPAL